MATTINDHTTQTIEYATLIANLTALNAKLNQFINGGVDDVVQTDAGPLKTLSRVIADLESIQYVLKAKQYDSFEEALSLIHI